MAKMKLGLLGRKLGMTQIFDENNVVLPVTVIEAGPNSILAVKSAEGKDGYDSIKVGFGERKASRINKARAGEAAKVEVAAPQHIHEFRLTAEDAAKFQAGASVTVSDVFVEGTKVDVTGTSKGRGFAGVMKRHGMSGMKRTHGAHEYFRHGGSIGTRLTPGHVIKGHHMAGHQGAQTVTTQNLLLAKVDAERNLLFIKGAVPGPNGGIVVVKHAIKG